MARTNENDQKTRKITDTQLLDVRIQRNKVHGEWSYSILRDTN